MTNFIEAYDNALSKEYCEHLLQKFEKSTRKRPGATGHGVNPEFKDSVDINISNYNEWEKEKNKIEEATYKHLTQYIKKYPFMITGPVSLFFPDPVTGQPTPISNDIVVMLSDEVLESLVRKVYRIGEINAQKYLQGKGGYHHWHSEVYPKLGDLDPLHRVVLFMFYLNDVEEGGETEFYYQEIDLKPTQGQMVIAPATFTHTHKGGVPISGDKYILTSWILFKSAEEIYG
jgi:hypothetical protein